MVLTIERYGAAVEYDLHAHVGLDLVDFFRHRHSWRKLDALLGQLPSGSAYWAARADDDEAAAELLAMTGGQLGGSPAPALREMTTTNQLLLDLLDMQQVIVQRLTILARHNPGSVTPVPRPSTGLARARERAEVQRVGDLVAEAHAAMARAADAEPDASR